MAKEIAVITAWLKLMTYGTGITVALKQFGNRLPYRWELFCEDRSGWLGTICFEPDEILQLSRFTRPEKIQFVANTLIRSFGMSDECPAVGL